MLAIHTQMIDQSHTNTMPADNMLAIDAARLVQVKLRTITAIATDIHVAGHGYVPAVDDHHGHGAQRPLNETH